MLQAIRRYGLMFVVRPLARLLFGLDAIGAEKLPTHGPAIVAANHNSHVDTLILLCLFPAQTLEKVRPVAAADHFDKGGFGSWFSRNVIGIIPIKRGAASRHEDVLAGAKEALSRGEILVVFPEGSRGAPEEMTRFKTGVARLAEFCPEASVTPVYIQGAGRSLPKRLARGGAVQLHGCRGRAAHLDRLTPRFHRRPPRPDRSAESASAAAAVGMTLPARP